ncbi:hypothetical protein ACIBO2_29160 [Nonomuraea sp. NPDC050022]|uniref:hypothetical protein n=1 Tax=unclassified Nonomuraea TaxID=2593643 RepID=UPI0033C481FA
MSYRSEAALVGLQEFLEFDSISQAPAITTPTMIVHLPVVAAVCSLILTSLVQF